MPVTPSKFSHELKIRIKKAETLDTLKEVYKTKKYSSINAAVNAALEKGLPLLLADSDYGVNPKKLASQISEQVLEQLLPISNSLIFNMRKITVLQTVQESMLGSLIQELEFFLKIKGISIDPAILEDFRLTLPTRFENDKQEMIERLFAAADASEEGENNE